MRRKYLPEMVMLIAALITCIITIIRHFSTLNALITLFTVMISFYIIGLIARFILNRLFYVDTANIVVDLEEGTTTLEGEENPELQKEKMSKN